MKKTVCMLLGICMILCTLLSGCTEDRSASNAEEFPTGEPLWKHPESRATQPPETEPEETQPTSPAETEPEPATTPPPVLDDDAIQAFIDDAAARYGAVGIQVAVVKGGQIAGLYASGWAIKGETPMTPEHKLRVASISKIIIGMAAMKLQEEGALTLGADISQFWNT